MTKRKENEIAATDGSRELQFHIFIKIEPACVIHHQISFPLPYKTSLYHTPVNSLVSHMNQEQEEVSCKEEFSQEWISR